MLGLRRQKLEHTIVLSSHGFKPLIKNWEGSRWNNGHNKKNVDRW